MGAVTKDVDVLWLDDGAWGGSTWQITAEYCGNGKTRFEVQALIKDDGI